MVRINGIGKVTIESQIANDIINGNLSALEEHLRQGWNIKENISIYCPPLRYYPPLLFAVGVDCFESVKWLVEHGAKINDKKHTIFLIAVRYCEEKTMVYLAENGANIHEVNHVGSDAFSEAIYGEKYHFLPILERLGHTAKEYGGKAFRSEFVSRKNNQVIEFFVNHGVDMNYNKPCQVFPLCDTPLCAAAYHADLEMCKYLVEHGADVTLGDKFGNRPYITALERGDVEMAEYFKSLEPADFHNLQNKLLELKPYKLPKSLLDFLQGDNLRLDFGSRDNFGCAYMDFFSLTDTIPMKVKRQKLLRLSREVDNFESYIVWNPKTKRIAGYDVEHEVFCDIAPFDTFMQDAANFMKKWLEGDFNGDTGG
jgi:ankyrin repeat protein